MQRDSVKCLSLANGTLVQCNAYQVQGINYVLANKMQAKVMMTFSSFFSVLTRRNSPSVPFSPQYLKADRACEGQRCLAECKDMHRFCMGVRFSCVLLWFRLPQTGHDTVKCSCSTLAHRLHYALALPYGKAFASVLHCVCKPLTLPTTTSDQTLCVSSFAHPCNLSIITVQTAHCISHHFSSFLSVKHSLSAFQCHSRFSDLNVAWAHMHHWL